MSNIDYETEAKHRTWWFNNTGGAAHGGVTVRDYFAAEALRLLSPMNSHAHNAKEAYRIADAMMQARTLDKQGEL